MPGRSPTKRRAASSASTTPATARPKKFAERSKKWRDWVFTHPDGKDAGVALYGVSFIRRNLRGYSASKSPVAFWKDELKAFAHQLNFTGPIFGSDLAAIFTEAREVSALVEFRKEGRGYGIFVREWYDDLKDGVKKGTWTSSANFTHLDSKPPYMPKEMVTHVDQGGMIRAYPERLGGL